MESKKVSIIVPVYKVEDFLEHCITTILNQTYTNLEIILVNDGSPDKCGFMCDEYAKNDNRIKVLHKDNGGLSAARNAGLEIATGDYIGFVDSDDWIHPEMYEKLMKAVNEEKSDIVECKFINVYDRNNKIGAVGTEEINTFSNLNALENHFNGKYFYRCVWSKIYKKDLFNHVRFPVDKLAEDLFVSHELFYRARKISHIDFTGYYYFQRPDSIMGKNDLKLTYDTVVGMMEQHKFICEKAPELKKFVDKLYMNCLLKSYAFFDRQFNSPGQYKSLVTDQLMRNDIKVDGQSKIMYLIYRLSPKTVVSLVSYVNKTNKLSAK